MSIIEDIRLELIKITASSDLKNLFNNLSEGNYYIEIILETVIGDFNEIDRIGYIYKNNFFASREEFKDNFIPKKINISIKEKARDLFIISQKLEGLYRINLFSKLEEKIQKYRRIKTEEIEYCDVSLDFQIQSVKLFALEGQEHSEGIEWGFKEKDFLSELSFDSQIINILEQKWFIHFNSKAKTLLEAGTDLLIKLLIESKNTPLDYSPLLLNFVKSVEVETAELYQNNKKYIKHLTRIIVKEYSNLSNGNNDIVRLVTFCEGYNKSLYYQPNGFKPLYYLFKYFLAPDNLKEIYTIEYPYPEKVKKFIKTNSEVIKTFSYLANQRNRFVHERMIESEIEFYKIYHDIYIVLNFIADLKSNI